MSLYTSFEWDKLCGEVSKLRIGRRPSTPPAPRALFGPA
jgi:hypothetical protein